METFMTGLLGVFLFPLLLLGAVPLFIYIYAILRWRAGASEEPGIGSYSLVLMFRLIALLLGLGSVALLFYALLSDRDNEGLVRICWPVLISSLVFLGIQLVVGSALGPADRFLPARRIFGGGLVAICGLITLAALVGFLVTKWEEVPDDPGSLAAKGHTDRLKGFGSWLLCFGAVYLASAIRMARAAGERALERLRHPTSP